MPAAAHDPTRLPPRCRPPIAVVIALAAVLGASATLGPAPRAEAQSGYRVCSVFLPADAPYADGDGLVVKIWKGDRHGDTCQAKLSWMVAELPRAFHGQRSLESHTMETCEDWADHIGTRRQDPCPGMTVNAIYRYTGPFDLKEKTPDIALAFYHS